MYLWFRRRADETAAPLAVPAQVPEGKRLYVFGDVHGRVDLLHALWAAIKRNIAQSAPAQISIIGLGDYIDRGPDSAAVIRCLLAGIGSAEMIPLRGNHEAALLNFLEHPAKAGPGWLRFGGEQTLKSYGVAPQLFIGVSIDWQRVRDTFLQCIPTSHVVFLQRMKTSQQIGDYFFVHAGARPKVALHRQSVDDLLSIRQGFADRDEPFDKMIVHGHTPVDRPFFGKFRINIDTGAYFSDRLSCLVLEGISRQMLEF